MRMIKPFGSLFRKALLFILLKDERSGSFVGSMDTLGAFRRMYARVAADGRAETLFGEGTLEKAVQGLEKYAIKGASKAIFWFEFPFIGEPRMDLLVGYKCNDLHPPVSFVAESNPLYQKFFDACAQNEAFSEYTYGFSLDLSSAPSATDAPGIIYLLPPLEQPTEDYVPALLKNLGGEERIPQVMAAFAAAPSLWHPHYVGYMAGRSGSPTRLGFSIMKKDCLYYSDHQEEFLRHVEEYMGFEFTAEGRELLCYLAEGGWIYDLQFNLFPDGTISDNLGVALAFGSREVDPRKAAGFLEQGDAGEKLRHLESLGLADSRWRQMDRACYGVQCIVKSEGKRHLVGDVVQMDGIKVRFKKGKAYLSKGYLLARSSYLDD